MLHETKRKIDILGLTETHLHHDIFDEEIAIDGYTFIRKDRKSSPGGGVGCYINNNLQWQCREDLEFDNIEGIWLELLIKNSKSLLVFVVY